MKWLLIAPLLLTACVSAEPAPSTVPTGVSSGVSAVNLGCSSDETCAALGAASVVTALVHTDPKSLASYTERREDSVVVKCQIKRPESEMTFACGSVAVTVQRHGSPTQELLRYRGAMFSVRALRDEEYDLQLALSGCATPETIRGARAGEVWTVTFDVPCEVTASPPTSTTN